MPPSQPEMRWTLEIREPLSLLPRPKPGEEMPKRTVKPRAPVAILLLLFANVVLGVAACTYTTVPAAAPPPTPPAADTTPPAAEEAAPGLVGANEAETLLDAGINTGGFGGPLVKFTEMNDEFSVIVGGRGGAIYNESFVVGGGLYFLANTSHIRDPSLGRENLWMWYGGIEFEYITRPRSLTHLSFSVLMGPGFAAWSNFGNRDLFFVLEPQLNGILNITPSLRVGLGASYRLVGSVELEGLSNGGVGGPAGAITFQFGGY